jgi:superfamily II DNA or RNA helicase
MKSIIKIEGADATIEGMYSLETVVDATSYVVAGHEFVAAFQNGFWDGRKKLFNKRRKCFPSGLVPLVVEALKEDGFEVEVLDSRQSPGNIFIGPHDLELNGISFDYPYEFQPKAAMALCKAGRGVLDVATNGGKSSIAALVIKMIKQPTLFVVPSLELLYQIKEVFEERLKTEVGIVGDGNWNPNIITVATIGTLYSRMATDDGKQLLNGVGLLIVDEVHHGSSDSYYEVMRACNAYYRFGMSGTPLKRTDGSSLKLIAVTGPVVYSIKNKELIARGISAQPYLKFIEINKPRLARSLKYRDVYVKGIVENEYRNNLLAETALQYAKEGHTVIILIREIAHGKIFDKILPSTVSHRFISGKETSEFRRQTLKDFKEGKIPILISSTILDEGVDVPNIDVGILAGGGKSSIKLLQRIGRTLRTGGSHDWVIIIDTIDLQHRYLAKHSYGRLQIYKEEDCFEMEVK